jgi:hypothetical protein
MSTEQSPIVGESGWGRTEVNTLGVFRDVKLWPGGGREWDWNETGTQHEPGIQLSDVEELLIHRADVVVLSRGRELRLQTRAETLALLADQGVEVVHDETSAAITAYNELAADGRRVAALIHSTC